MDKKDSTRRILERCVCVIDNLMYATPGTHRVDDDESYEWAWEELSDDAQEELTEAVRDGSALLKRLKGRVDVLAKST